VKCLAFLAFFGGVFGFFMFWQSGNPDRTDYSKMEDILDYASKFSLSNTDNNLQNLTIF